MRKNPVSQVFDIPQYTYFEFGNTFTGSLGSLSYKIVPGEQFTCALIWQKLKKNGSTPWTKKAFTPCSAGWKRR